MMIELPNNVIKAKRINPKSIVIFGHPKIGKTTALAKLDNCLVLDFEQGTDFVDALKIDIITKSKEQNVLPIVYLKQLVTKIKEENEKKGDYVYKYIAIDTVSALEDLVLPLANSMYKKTSMGKNWIGNDVTLLPNGAGYRYTREALLSVVNQIASLCDTVIILGHTKDKDIEINGESITEKSLDLTGKMSAILSSQVDAIGYMYRKDNETIINFVPSDSLVCGGRSEHLKNKKITVIKSDENGNLTVDWSQIFINK